MAKDKAKKETGFLRVLHKADKTSIVQIGQRGNIFNELVANISCADRKRTIGYFTQFNVSAIFYRSAQCQTY